MAGTDASAVWLTPLVILVASSVANCEQGEASAEDSPALRVEIPAPGGMIAWDQAAASVADACRLDGEALRPLFPAGRTRLSSPKTRLLFASVNLTTRGGLRISAVNNARGEDLLVVELERAWLRRQTGRLERIARELQDDSEPRTGCRLSLPRGMTKGAVGREFVVLVHGYNGRSDSMQPLRSRLEQTGLRCGDFAWPNDGALEAAATALADQLVRLKAAEPDLRIAFVTHSAGGLIVRRVIEDPALDPGNVSRLIMVAPPNHGSNLARLPLGLDVWEHLVTDRPPVWERWLTAWIADGLEEGRHDLQPGSAWLTALNERPRNERVAYSILLGTNGLLDRSRQQNLITSWDRCARRFRPAAVIDPRIRPILVGEELIEGLGDSAVTVESGHLDGVPDIVVLPTQHDCIEDGLPGEVGRKLFESVVARLPLTVGAPDGKLSKTTNSPDRRD